MTGGGEAVDSTSFDLETEEFNIQIPKILLLTNLPFQEHRE